MPNHNSSQKDGQGALAVPSNQTPEPALSNTTVQTIIGLLSRADVAQRLGVCPHTIQRLTRRGLLPALVFNKRLIRYSPEVVEAYIKSAAIGGLGVA